MIVVQSYAGQRVGVLGLGRSGLAAAGALQAGGATPVWPPGCRWITISACSFAR